MGLVRLEPSRMEGREWREGWSRGEAPISSLAGRAISPTPGNGHVQPPWRGLALSPGTALAGARLRGASAHNVARRLGDGARAGRLWDVCPGGGGDLPRLGEYALRGGC